MILYKTLNHDKQDKTIREMVFYTLPIMHEGTQYNNYSINILKKYETPEILI